METCLSNSVEHLLSTELLCFWRHRRNQILPKRGCWAPNNALAATKCKHGVQPRKAVVTRVKGRSQISSIICNSFATPCSKWQHLVTIRLVPITATTHFITSGHRGSFNSDRTRHKSVLYSFFRIPFDARSSRKCKPSRMLFFIASSSVVSSDPCNCNSLKNESMKNIYKQEQAWLLS